jgi:predicted short-subunit dehydrogenase-like oxidoreductase (DUF2520 family)
MQLDISFSLPGPVDRGDVHALIAHIFAPDTGFAVKSLIYEYVDFYSVQNEIPLSTTVDVIAWHD